MRVSVNSAQILAVIHLLHSHRWAIPPAGSSLSTFHSVLRRALRGHRFSCPGAYGICLKRPERTRDARDPSGCGDRGCRRLARSSGPAKVMVGAYINDIQELDFRSNSYAIDLYVWFRWKPAPDLNPTMEFINRYASDANLRDELYDAPKPMPDGSVYAIIRYQGQFSTKFRLEKYPFDTQELLVVMEDTVAAADAQVYVADENCGVAINPDITLPGSKVGKPGAAGGRRAYPTNFGDLAEPEATRLFADDAIHPGDAADRCHVNVDYLMMIDKVYLLAYLFIILALDARGDDLMARRRPRGRGVNSRHDRAWVGMLLGAYLLANIAVAGGA